MEVSNIEIIPTVVPTSIAEIAAAAMLHSRYARALHIDITDGVFAPNTTWFPGEETLPAIDGFIYEVHLMVSKPHAVGLRCLEVGARRIIGHIEAMGEEASKIISAWKFAGAQEVGLGVLFQTPIEAIDAYVADIDVVQMMSIASIGVQGIPYEPSAPERIARLHAKHPDLLIADDGGVGESNIASLAHAGVRRFCAGSALSKAKNPHAAYERLLSLAQSAL